MNHQKSHTPCILHDTFIYQGGAERLMIMMARALDADLVSGYFDPGSFDPRKEGVTGDIISLGKRSKNKYLNQLKLQFDFLFSTQCIRKYHTLILSGDCLLAIRNSNPQARIIYYCHTPPRYLFDQRDAYAKKVPVFFRWLYHVYIACMRGLYLHYLNRVDIIYTNSINTQKRIQEFTGKQSSIIYPAVDTSFFYPDEKREDYYFSYARLSSIKRIDVIVRAFQKMPHKRLIIQYGLNDPQKQEIERLIKGYPHIELVHLETQEDLRDMIARSFAVIYIPENEDFGMIPLEAMSCGVPVIGVNDGGLKETIIPERTGWLLGVDSLENDIVSLVQKLDWEIVHGMKEACRDRAYEFSLSHFQEQVRSLLS